MVRLFLKLLKMEYKVIALSVGGRFNKVYHNGDIVSDNCFEVGAKELVNQGFLQPIEAKKAQPKDEVKDEAKEAIIDAKEVLKKSTKK